MRQETFTLVENTALTRGTHRLRLRGNAAGCRPGGFVQVQIPKKFLRRPFSICHAQDDMLTLLVQRAGAGTDWLCALEPGARLDVLTGLGNGFDLARAGAAPLLLGGGSGVGALYGLCAALTAAGARAQVALGFRTAAQAVYAEEFAALGARVRLFTEDGSLGAAGRVTAALEAGDYSHVFACGPLGMLREVDRRAKAPGQLSLEARMGCGFGACMGCTIQTAHGPRRVCRDGPVFQMGEVVW